MTEKQQRIRNAIQDFCLMDDEFMTAFFDDNIECTEYVLRIILDKPDLQVTAVHSQWNVTNLYGRSGRLDIKAVDNAGRFYDIEIQRADKGAGAKRARFNSALLDTRFLQAGQSTEALPETYVIFITENDVLGLGKACYHIDRVVAESGEFFGDMVHIVYVNNAYRGDDTLGQLMHDFACCKAENMMSSLLARYAKSIKLDTDKVVNMSYFMEELVKEERAEAQEEIQIDTAVKMLNEKMISEERLAAFFDFTPEQVAKVIDLYNRQFSL